MSEFELSLGDRIHERRIDLGYTLRELENKTGISASYILRIEKGDKKNPSIVVLKKLSSVLNIDLTGLFMKSNAITNHEIIPFLKTTNFSYNNNEIKVSAKNTLSKLVEYILSCDWNNENKIKDIKNIIDFVDKIKNEL